MPDTETIDRLYLEWSQFTKARTAREIELERQRGEARLALVSAEVHFGIIADEAAEDRIQAKALRYRDKIRAALARTAPPTEE